MKRVTVRTMARMKENGERLPWQRLMICGSQGGG